jgi:PIN domain nuclease of toxin-antitoxin system
MTVLLDTHVLLWWAAESDRLSPAALDVLGSADELAVAAITWWELAWLVRRGRVGVGVPARTLFAGLARDVRTVALTPSIAATAAELGDDFPRDPADRLIYATAIEHGWRLVSKDRRLQDHDPEGIVVAW